MLKPGTQAKTMAAVVALTVLALLPGISAASFTTPETVSAPGVQAVADDLAVDGRGNALAAWSTVYPDPGTLQVRSRSRKGVWGPVVTLSEAGEQSGAAQVAFDAHGNALAAWSSFELLPGDPYIGTARVRAALRPAGGNFGESQVVREEVGELQFRVQDLAATDGAVLAWTRFAAGDEIPSLELAFRPAGDRFGDPAPMGRGDFAQTKIDRHDNAIVAWARESGPFSFPVYYSLRPAGGDFSAPAHLVDGPGPTALAMDRRGNSLVTSSDYDYENSKDRLALSYRPAGGSFDPPQVVEGARGAEATFDNGGNAVLAWATDFGRGRVMTMTRLRDGTLTDPQTVSALGAEVRPVVAAGRGSVVVWSRAEILGPLSRGDFQVEAAFGPRPGKRAFGAPQLVSDPPPDAFDPRVQLDPHGAALVIWTRGDRYEYAQPRSVQFSLGRP